MRRTLMKAVEVRGVGLHGGQPVTMTLAPSDVGMGIRFIRIDVPVERQTIPARYDLVSDTQLCTKLTNAHGVSVGTVEHIMAALAGCAVTDVVIALDGPEVPIMDGSAAPFVEAILEAGLRDIAAPLRAIRILEPVRHVEGDKIAELLPAERFAIDYRIDFEDRAIGTQSCALEVTGSTFATDLADCRTFGHLREVEHLRALGLARGGSLKNAIVVDKGRVLNAGGLRRHDEFVRHKMLDAVGDLALAGAPIIGRYRGFKSGHGMTNQLLRKLFDTPGAWTSDEVRPGQVPGGVIMLPVAGAGERPALAV